MKRMKYAWVFLVTLYVMNNALAQAPGIEWKNVYQHVPYTESGACVQPTTDGGYIVGAVSAFNAWILKIDDQGNEQWNTYLPDDTLTGLTSIYSIRQTTDNGYIVAGSDFLPSGADSIGNHGARDFLVMKLTSGGTISWIKAFGGSNNEEARSVIQTTDGGYIVAGYTGSSDGDLAGNAAPWYTDYWVVKLDASGNIAWQKTYGGTLYDYATAIRQTADGGYIVAGYSGSKDGDVTGTHWGGSDDDYWLVKLDASGTISWQQSYGGSGEDQAYSIEQTTDGGYVVTGSSASNDGLVSGNHNPGGSKKDFWTLKLDTSGNLSWQICYGGTGDDIAYSIQQTMDMGYILAGTVKPTDTTGVDITGYHGNAGTDYWIVKLDGAGNLSWQKCLGGQGEEDARAVSETADGGFIIAGTEHSADGDVGYTTDVNYSHTWVVKLGGGGTNGLSESTLLVSMCLFPNPVNDLLTLNDIPVGAVITIQDLTGKVVYEASSSGIPLKVLCTDFTEGIYLVSCLYNGEKSCQKLWVRN